MTLADIQAGNIGGLPGGYQALPASDAPATLEKIISNTVGFFTVVGGLTFIIYLVLAGLTWITAREEECSGRIGHNSYFLGFGRNSRNHFWI